MLESRKRRLFASIPLSLMVILSACLFVAPSCDASTYVLGTLEGQGLGGENAGGEAGCRDLGEGCEEPSDCCSSACVGGACIPAVPACRPTGTECAVPTECCSLGCVEGVCASACAPDVAACDSDAECCSGVCEGSVCRALNDACLTSGNRCNDNSACCSGLCDAGICSIGSSFCVQTGDICARPEDCCSQSCLLVEGATVGTCDAAPTGPSFCSSGIAGSLCEDCNDCCSRLCVPFGVHGLSVCALAKGCRQTGELCADDADCCGGDETSPLPGAGNVTCEKRSDGEWGICRNAMSCSPQGNVCHIQNYACGVSAASNKCCALDETEGVCQLDEDGVPRCNGLGSSCQVEGDACATNEDCCAGKCLPGPDSVLICKPGSSCVEVSDPCTATSECCPGMWCERQAGTAFGRCSVEEAVGCSLLGQICGNTEMECCPGLSCEFGRCRGESR